LKSHHVIIDHDVLLARLHLVVVGVPDDDSEGGCARHGGVARVLPQDSRGLTSESEGGCGMMCLTKSLPSPKSRVNMAVERTKMPDKIEQERFDVQLERIF
jgi:hypothetical protein